MTWVDELRQKIEEFKRNPPPEFEHWLERAILDGTYVERDVVISNVERYPGIPGHMKVLYHYGQGRGLTYVTVCVEDGPFVIGETIRTFVCRDPFGHGMVRPAAC